MHSLGVRIVVATLGAAFLAPAPAILLADDAKHKSQSERYHDKAQELRERSGAAARSKVGYETIYGQVVPGDPDTYYALSLQIEQLAEILRALRRAGEQRQGASNAAEIAGIPTLPVTTPLTDVKAVYGPSGPTEKSVRLILEYRLLLTGNPRLKVGSVSEDDVGVSAQIMTVDGSLVEEYRIDKKTGVWQLVR